MDNRLPVSSQSYVFGLDLVRFAAALGVALFHLTWRAPAYADTLPYGWIGVEVFFVISGFVIANSAEGRSASEFAVGRFLRLYPAAWPAACINLACILAIGGAAAYRQIGVATWSEPEAIASSLLLFGMRFLSSSYWTLPVELSFYGLVFLLLASNRVDAIQKVAVALIFWTAPYIVAISLHAAGIVNWPRLTLAYDLRNITLLRHGLYFGLGVLIWCWREGHLTRSGAIAAGAAAPLAALEIWCRARELAPYMNATDGGQRLAFLAIFAFGLGVAAIMASAAFNEKFPKGPAPRRAARTAGLVTYPFYLLHEAVGGFVILGLAGLGLTYGLRVALAFAAIGAVSYFIAAHLEPAIRAFLARAIQRAAPRSIMQNAGPIRRARRLSP